MNKNEISYKINIVVCIINFFIITILLVLKDNAVSTMDSMIGKDESLFPPTGESGLVIGQNFPEMEVVTKWKIYFMNHIKYYMLFLFFLSYCRSLLLQ